MADADRCVCCGEIIPEGRQVCDSCLEAIGRYLQEERNAPWPPKREAMVIGIRYRCSRICSVRTVARARIGKVNADGRAKTAAE